MSRTDKNQKVKRGPSDYEFYYDYYHYTPDGNRIIAEELFRGLSEKGIFDKVTQASSYFAPSSLTFSEYFNKLQMQDRVIDTSMDVSIFAREIAPCYISQNASQGRNRSTM